MLMWFVLPDKISTSDVSVLEKAESPTEVILECNTHTHRFSEQTCTCGIQIISMVCNHGNTISSLKVLAEEYCP
jgi:hypothetical protein